PPSAAPVQRAGRRRFGICAAPPATSVVAQGPDRVDLRGAPRGDEAGGQGRRFREGSSIRHVRGGGGDRRSGRSEEQQPGGGRGPAKRTGGAGDPSASAELPDSRRGRRAGPSGGRSQG